MICLSVSMAVTLLARNENNSVMFSLINNLPISRNGAGFLNQSMDSLQ